MKKFENVTFLGEMSLFIVTYLEKQVRYIYFFIILMNPAKEYLYTREIRKKIKVGIFFYS